MGRWGALGMGIGAVAGGVWIGREWDDDAERESTIGKGAAAIEVSIVYTTVYPSYMTFECIPHAFTNMLVIRSGLVELVGLKRVSRTSLTCVSFSSPTRAHCY